METPVSKWLPQRLRFWVISIALAAVSWTTWWGVDHWQRHHSIQHGNRTVEQVRIIDNGLSTPLDLVAGHSDVCEAHGTKMTVGTVPVVYGLLDVARSNSLAVIACPHGGWRHEGGCIVMSAPIARAYLCPDCIARAASVPPGEAADATDAIHLTSFGVPPEQKPFSPDAAAYWQPTALLPTPDLHIVEMLYKFDSQTK